MIEETHRSANNLAGSLIRLERFEEVKVLMRKMIPVARRTLGEGHRLTLKMRKCYAGAFILDADASLDNLHEAVSTLEDTVRIARRVFGKSHPLVADMERALREAHAILRARETPPSKA